MSSKYKSPLIKSRSTSVTSTPVSTPQKIESSSRQESANSTDNSSSTFFVHDTSPVCNFSEPRFSNPRPRGSPYQWRSPYKYNNSWSSNPNNSGSFTPEEASNCHEYRHRFNKYKNQNHNNDPNLSNKNNDEHYFHPSMLEDPWAPLLYINK